MLILALTLCVFTTTSCAGDDPLPIISPEGVKDGFAAEAIASAGHVGSIPATSTTVTTTTTTSTTTTTTTTTTTVLTVSSFRDDVERWRPTVAEAVFAWGGDEDDVHRFLRIMQCESGGDPTAKNPNSSASGLMQHLTRYWDGRAAGAGIPGADVFDGGANIWVSAYLALAAPGGGWQHWVCK
jgi:hypothetical protein